MPTIIRDLKGELLRTVGADTLSGADLSGAGLIDANLSGADLSGANLSGAEIRNADLTGADLTSADLGDADLMGADLTGADLTGASLRGAILVLSKLADATLINADLTGADLTHAHLPFAHMSSANMARSIMGFTTIANCKTLHMAVGLDDVCHFAPSSIDAITLRACFKDLAPVFLKGVGYSDEEIETMQGLYGRAFVYYSCFISYARADLEFATRLHADLGAREVSCWRDEVDLRGGVPWRMQTSGEIKRRDKTVVVCSETSLKRTEVVEEIIEVIEDERRTGKFKLFPIRIDDYIFTDEAREAAAELPDRQRREDWLTYLKNFHVLDFKGWKKHDEYVKALDRLVANLKSKDGKRDGGGLA